KSKTNLEKEITSANEMLSLQLQLLAVLLSVGDNRDGKNSGTARDFHEPISSFYNCSWVQNLALGWLDELQTHRWESNSGTFIFLWPWSKGKFTNEDLMELGKLFHMFSIGFLQAFHSHASQWQLECEFCFFHREWLLTTGGCELHFEESSVGFMRVGYQGSDFLSFQNNSWLPSPEGGGLRVSADYSVGTNLPDAEKADLQRQVRPEAWLSNGSSLGPGCLMLVSHVYGFHPKPIWVMWMWGEQEHLVTQRERQTSMGLIFLAVIVPLVLLTGLVFWLRWL
ncbi:hypothetical protein HPG69_006381, partial [Diceros bicornis minor]